MRISFLLSSLWLSGGVRVVVEYASRLSRRGHQITLITPDGTLDPDMVSELDSAVRVQQSRVPREPRMNPGQMGRLSWSLAQAVPQSDIVISTHTSTTVAGLLAARLLKKGRLVWLYQDYREMFKGRPIEDWLMRNALRWHELALVVAGYSQQELNTYSPGRVVVVGEGLSQPELFQPSPIEEFPKNKGGQTILFLGDMRHRKGLFDFLRAAELVYKELPTIKLLIISKDECTIDSDIPFKYIHRPSRAELGRMYATCDLYVSASWWESFGLPPLEAMACGAPVVLADARGVREYARPGENCLMVPARDRRALAEAMIQVLTDPALAGRLRRNGPPTAANFTWSAAVDRFEQAITSLLDVTEYRSQETW
jgi:glycosyltransferase involved in cell wall biosynthesis